MPIPEIHQIITETVPVFFFIYDLESHNIEYISPQFFNWVKNENELRGLDEHEKLKAIISKDYQKKFQQFFEDLTAKNNYKSSVELKTAGNIEEIRWFEFNTFKASKKTGRPNKIVGHIIDITKKKEQYEILNRENHRIETFLNMMAHDLKLPFASFSIVVDLLKERMTKEELDKYCKYLDILKTTTKDSGDLIDRLLYFATLKGETSKLDLELHDVRMLIKGCIEKMHLRISEKKLLIVYEFPDYPVEVLMDVPLFKQIIQNLLSNAIKFTSSGGKITFKADYLKDGSIKISISDNGIGIPEEHLKNIFKNISEIKREGLEGEKSTGLGLYICQQVMKIHNGEILVSSKENEGTTFTLHLPEPNSSSTYF